MIVTLVSLTLRALLNRRRTLLLGLLGFAMRRFGWPVAPAVIGLILGPVAETNLRRALSISDGDLGVLVQSGFSKIVLGVTVMVLVVSLVARARTRRSAAMASA